MATQLDQAIDWLYDHRKVDWETGCWEWTGHTIGNGKYGRVSPNWITRYTGETIVSRISAKVFLGSAGGRGVTQQWRHKCGNGLCFNYAHLERKRSRSGYAHCTKCGKEKPLDVHHFNKSAHKPMSELLACQQGFHPWCKQCWSEYYQANKDRWKAISKRWREEHREQDKLNRRSRADKRRTTRRGSVSLRRIWRRDDGTCHLCGKEVESLADVHFDRIIPLSKGGEHTENNIAVAHATCNMRKYTKLIPSTTAQLKLI